jgi:hypothetical protein
MTVFKGSYRPRVESQSIERLQVGAWPPVIDEDFSIPNLRTMYAGLIWSGIPASLPQQPDLPYAQVDELIVNCVGLASDIWVRDCPRLSVEQVLSGRIHTPRIAVGETYKIGGFGRFGCGSNPECGDFHEDFQDQPPSPRSFAFCDSLGNSVEEGVLIRDSQALAGQIIVNHNNEPSSVGWQGNITIGIDENDPLRVVLGPTRPIPDRAPYYDRFPAELGNGAVGLVPFAVHLPLTNSLNATPPIVSTRFNDPSSPCDPQWASIEFYGPVKLASNPNALPPFAVQVSDLSAFNLDVSRLTQYRLASTTGQGRRRVELRGREGQMLPAANEQLGLTATPPNPDWRYRLHSAGPAVTEAGRLRCDLAPLPNVPVQAFENVAFEVFLDCGGTPCIAEDQANCTWAPALLCDSIDFNNDGLFPADEDLLAFLRVRAGGPCDDPSQPPVGNVCNDDDFNNDGLFPDDNDVTAFLSVLAGGPCVVE